MKRLATLFILTILVTTAGFAKPKHKDLSGNIAIKGEDVYKRQAQTTNPIQEAMANYDYETALMLIDQETPTVPLLLSLIHIYYGPSHANGCSVYRYQRLGRCTYSGRY